MLALFWMVLRSELETQRSYHSFRLRDGWEMSELIRQSIKGEMRMIDCSERIRRRGNLKLAFEDSLAF